MTELLSHLDAPSDAELISRVRGGDVDAYGVLFARHVESARRLARQLVRGHDADDLVSDAFAKVMSVLRSGGGPDVAFRAYLLTAVRRLHVDRIRSQARLTTSDDMSEFDPGVPFNDTMVAKFESGAAAKAFASLPERWQLVLWHLEVEGQKPAEVAPLLGMSPNSVSALAYRAREGLRQAFLSAHLNDIGEADCRWVTEHLGAYVRKGLSKRDSAKVAAHIDGCRSCTAMYLEVSEVNSNLAGIIAPLLLGSLAAGYISGAGTGAAAGGLVALADRAKDVVVAHVVPVAAGTAAASVAAVTVVGATITTAPSDDEVFTSQPAIVERVDSAEDRGAAAGASRLSVPLLDPSMSPGDLLAIAPTALPADPLLPVPTIQPVATDVPAEVPTGLPTDAAVGEPTEVPTGLPTGTPTGTPTDSATDAPAEEPTTPPTGQPSASPSQDPATAPGNPGDEDPGTGTPGDGTNPGTGNGGGDGPPGTGGNPGGNTGGTGGNPGGNTGGTGGNPGGGTGGTGGTTSPGSDGDGGAPEPTPSTPPIPQPAPLDPGPPLTDLRVGTIAITGGAAAVTVTGLPDAAVTVRVRLRSASGLTTFAPTSSGLCRVTKAQPTVARCQTRNAAIRLGRARVFPRQLEAVIPLAYPATLNSDVLRFTVRVANHADPNPRDNRYRLAFTPERLSPGLPGLPLPTADPTPSATPAPTPSGDPSPTVTTTPGLTPSDQPSEPTASPTAGGLPEPSEEPSPTDEPSAIPTETPTAGGLPGPLEDPPSPTNQPTDQPTDMVMPTPGPDPTPDETPGPVPDATLEPTPEPTAGPGTPEAGDPAASGIASPGPVPDPGSDTATSPEVPTADIRLAAERRRTDRGVGQFRVLLTGPAGVGGVPVELQLRFNHSKVALEGLPAGCSLVDGRAGRVRCDVDGSFTGVFDAELAGVAPKRVVTVTAHGWLPGYDEVDRGDNVATVRLWNTDRRAERSG